MGHDPSGNHILWNGRLVSPCDTTEPHESRIILGGNNAEVRNSRVYYVQSYLIDGVLLSDLHFSFGRHHRRDEGGLFEFMRVNLFSSEFSEPTGRTARISGYLTKHKRW